MKQINMAFIYLVLSWFITQMYLMWLWSKVFPTSDPGTIALLMVYVLGLLIPFSIAKKFGWFGLGD